MGMVKNTSNFVLNLFIVYISYFLYYFTAGNTLTGSIPSEIGLLTDLNDLELCKLQIQSCTFVPKHITSNTFKKTIPCSNIMHYPIFLFPLLFFHS